VVTVLMTSGGAQFVNRSAQEHLLYIQEKVNPILEALVTAVLLERPEDPSFFMLKWLCEQTKSLDATDQGSGDSRQRTGTTADEIVAVREEIRKLTERKAELLALKRGGGARGDAKSDKSTKADDDEEEDEDDDDDEAPDMMPPPPAYFRGARQSVSAEAYGDWNRKAAFVAPVYEKSSEQKERIERCLGPSFLFNSLEKQDMQTVVMAFKERQVEANTRIIEQGDDGQSMFLIEEGEVNCFKTTEGEEKMEKLVKTCSAGDVFGELALLYNCPRAASVVSTGKSILWELDRETFNNIVKDAAAKKRTTYAEFLKKVPLLRNVEPYEMMTIADAVKVETIEKDIRIIQQGDVGDKFFLVLEGECIAKKAIAAGEEETPVMTHKVGDYFGELALLGNTPRAASVYANDRHVKLLSLDRKTFKRMLGPLEDILRREAKRYDLPAN